MPNKHKISTADFSSASSVQIRSNLIQNFLRVYLLGVEEKKILQAILVISKAALSTNHTKKTPIENMMRY